MSVISKKIATLDNIKEKKILIIGEGSGGKNHFKALRLIEKKIVIR